MSKSKSRPRKADPEDGERSGKGKPRPKAVPFPTKEQVLAFIRESPTPVGKREIARAFHLKGSDRIPLKALLKELEREGGVDRGRKRQLSAAGALPEVAVVQVIGPDADGDLWARPVDLRPDDAEPKIVIVGDHKLDRPLAAGDRVLVRLQRTDAEVYEARPIRRLESRAQRVVGLFEKDKDGFGRVTPTDKRIKTEFSVHPKDAGQARSGDLVIIEAEPVRRLGSPKARVVERVGRADEARSISLISIAEHQIPFQFPPAALTQAAEAGPATLGSRTDLRQVPLVTIDGDDARDFDDAVFAEPDKDEKNPGGWRLIVAIADVAHYVRDGDALDRTARERGNSVYFPDRVVPMLPEELSNGLCSLNPQVDRLCMVCDMDISAAGKIQRYRFYPGVMHSKARLTYTEVAAALFDKDAAALDKLRELLPQLDALDALYRVLAKAREKRGAIDFETIETIMEFDENGKIARIVPYARNDAHRIIEECMLAANVCASDFLAERGHPALYRIHEGPTEEKLKRLRDFLKEFGLDLGGGNSPKAGDYAKLLAKIKNRPDLQLLQTVMLRSLRQAVYSPDNVGHFGLAYESYTHFTSPIRRYPDLLIHRAIKAVLGGERYSPGGGDEGWEVIGMHCSQTERRADEATRDVTNWLKCYYMQDRIGEEFVGSVSAVVPFGIFVALDDVYVEGLVHVSELGSDYFHYDDARHELLGERTGKRFRLADRVRVQLVRVDLETTKIDFRLLPDLKPAAVDAAAPRAGKKKK